VSKSCSVFVYSKRSMARRLRLDIALLSKAGKVAPGTVFSLAHLKFKKHVEKTGAAKSDQHDQGPGVHKVESSKENGIFSVTKMSERSLTTPWDYLKKSYKDDGVQILVVADGKTKRNGPKLWLVRFRLDIRKIFFTERVAQHWNRKKEGCGIGILGGMEAVE